MLDFITFRPSRECFYMTVMCKSEYLSFSAGMTGLDGVVYCIGGSNGSTGSKVCFKLPIGGKKWERIADLHTGKPFSAEAFG